jgi:predicted small metal-binding protein
MKTLNCNTVVPELDCAFVVSGGADDELVVRMVDHTKADHAGFVEGMSPERLQALKDRIRDLLQNPKAS